MSVEILSPITPTWFAFAPNVDIYCTYRLSLIVVGPILATAPSANSMFIDSSIFDLSLPISTFCSFG